METIQKYFSEDFSVFSVSPWSTSINLSKKRKKNHAQKSVCFKSEEIITINLKKKLVKTDIFQRIKPHDAYISWCYNATVVGVHDWDRRVAYSLLLNLPTSPKTTSCASWKSIDYGNLYSPMPVSVIFNIITCPHVVRIIIQVIKTQSAVNGNAYHKIWVELFVQCILIQNCLYSLYWIKLKWTDSGPTCHSYIL